VISAIVFDFDGVLVDSEPLHLRSYQEVLEPFGLSLPREKYYSSYLGYDDAGVFKAIAEARDWPLDEQKLRALIDEKCRVFEALKADGTGGDMLYPGAPECVARLAAAWPLGIASGAARPEIESTLQGSGLDRYFRFIVAAGETPAGKPAPDPYRQAAKLHGHSPESCVAIEDSRWGIESAKSAGLWCIGITHTYPVSELLDADAIVSSLAELTPELIKNLT
jgi:beta-phosphoglucomutase